jgi:hypothetical protein
MQPEKTRRMENGKREKNTDLRGLILAVLSPKINLKRCSKKYEFLKFRSGISTTGKAPKMSYK